MKKEQITTIRLPVKLYEKIRLLSYKNRKSINNIMVEAIAQALDYKLNELVSDKND